VRATRGAAHLSCSSFLYDTIESPWPEYQQGAEKYKDARGAASTPARTRRPGELKAAEGLQIVKLGPISVFDTVLTGLHCTALAKLPVAGSGGRGENSAPELPNIEARRPVVCGKARTFREPLQRDTAINGDLGAGDIGALVGQKVENKACHLL
jgi:hypothetical protein